MKDNRHFCLWFAAFALVGATTDLFAATVITGDQGLDQYRPGVRQDPPLTAPYDVDAHGAVWHQVNSKNTHPSWDNPCRQGTDQINPYPINLKYPVRWSGGIVQGHVPLQVERKPLYCNSAAMFMDGTQASGYKVENVRMVDVWDGFRQARGASGEVRGLWLTNARDDALENDQLASMTIADSLMEGLFNGLSFAPGNNGTATGQGSVITIDGVLMRMHGYLDSDSATAPHRVCHGHVFKGQGGIRPEFHIRNNVFAYELTPVRGCSSMDRLTVVLDNMTECENNTVLWLGAEHAPDWMSVWPERCFTVLEGQEAHEYWQRARTDWINSHPDIDRLPTDPPVQPVSSGDLPIDITADGYRIRIEKVTQ